MKKRVVCNVVQSHKRILEAHRLWHQALNCYFDPEGFRTNVNATIQALRNVTFAIQNEKHNIVNFETWYAEWQDRLKNDEIMRWLCDARTAIVHKKDLELHSSATVTIRCYETILKATIAIPVFLSGKTILKFLVKENIIDEALKGRDAYAVVERRWVVNDFPQYDVLYILAYGIGQLSMMVQEAHTNSGNDIKLCSVVDSFHQITLNESNIPSCMDFTKEAMQETIGLEDFITREFSYRIVNANPKLDAKSKRRYKNALNDLPPKDVDDPFALSENLFHSAKQILQKDGYHINVLYTQSSDKKWSLTSPIFEDQVSKHIFWNNLAERVKSENIVSVIFICECWVGSIEVLQETGLRAANQPDRKEALSLEVFTSDMRGKSYQALFHKNIFGKVVFDRDSITDDVDMSVGYIKPIADAWNSIKE